MTKKENISLKDYNTFGIDVNARYFTEATSIDDIKSILKEKTDFFLIGGGSNLLLINDITKLVVHINTKGKIIIGENRKYTYIKVAAGENWHDFVLWCIKNDYGGVENLAKIPGNVGTAPIQNIGAYGVEVKDVIDEVHSLEINSGNRKVFNKTQCNFGYRESIFKNKEKGKYIITDVVFKLTKKNHQLNFSYGAISKTLEERNIHEPSIQDIANAVIDIRTAKLPNPEEIGNSGSFFKNPIITKEQFNSLKEQYPNIPNYPVSGKEKLIKLAAGWLIDQCGFKGKRVGDAGVHENQALVLVNYGKATGSEILALAREIQDTVLSKYDVSLEMEVNLVS
jgi:UDP-N-acetylmuramate dehydrogenase